MDENQQQYEFYQIPHVGVQDRFGSSTEVAARSVSDAAGLHPPIVRSMDMKMCNFGALEVGRRMSTDYTRTVTMEFINKGILEGAFLSMALMTSSRDMGSIVLFISPLQTVPVTSG